MESQVGKRKPGAPLLYKQFPLGSKSVLLAIFGVIAPLDFGL